MDTGIYTGPMAVLSNSRFVRGGEGLSVSVWDIDSLETHGRWSKHLSLGVAGTMLRALGQTREAYHCRTVDLEAGGRTVMRHLDHGGHINGFSTSTGANCPNGPAGGDPNVFMTAFTSGYARLYDVRQVLPVMTINSTTSSDGQNCAAAVLAHPDGIPCK